MNEFSGPVFSGMRHVDLAWILQQ